MSTYTISFPKTRRDRGEPVRPAHGAVEIMPGYGYNMFKKVHPPVVDPNPQLGAISLAFDLYLTHVEFELSATIANAPQYLCSGDTVIVESPSLNQAQQHADHLLYLANACGLQITAHGYEYVSQMYTAPVPQKYTAPSVSQAVAEGAAEYYKNNSPLAVAYRTAEYYKRTSAQAVASRAATYYAQKYGIA